mgnify:CR=1 FL=1
MGSNPRTPTSCKECKRLSLCPIYFLTDPNPMETKVLFFTTTTTSTNTIIWMVFVLKLKSINFYRRDLGMAFAGLYMCTILLLFLHFLDDNLCIFINTQYLYLRVCPIISEFTPQGVCIMCPSPISTSMYHVSMSYLNIYVT